MAHAPNPPSPYPEQEYFQQQQQQHQHQQQQQQQQSQHQYQHQLEVPQGQQQHLLQSHLMHMPPPPPLLADADKPFPIASAYHDTVHVPEPVSPARLPSCVIQPPTPPTVNAAGGSPLPPFPSEAWSSAWSSAGHMLPSGLGYPPRSPISVAPAPVLDVPQRSQLLHPSFNKPSSPVAASSSSAQSSRGASPTLGRVSPASSAGLSTRSTSPAGDAKPGRTFHVRVRVPDHGNSEYDTYVSPQANVHNLQQNIASLYRKMTNQRITAYRLKDIHGNILHPKTRVSELLSHGDLVDVVLKDSDEHRALSTGSSPLAPPGNVGGGASPAYLSSAASSIAPSPSSQQAHMSRDAQLDLAALVQNQALLDASTTPSMDDLSLGPSIEQFLSRASYPAPLSAIQSSRGVGGDAADDIVQQQRQQEQQLQLEHQQQQQQLLDHQQLLDQEHRLQQLQLQQQYKQRLEQAELDQQQQHHQQQQQQQEQMLQAQQHQQIAEQFQQYHHEEGVMDQQVHQQQVEYSLQQHALEQQQQQQVYVSQGFSASPAMLSRQSSLASIDLSQADEDRHYIATPVVLSARSSNQSSPPSTEHR